MAAYWFVGAVLAWVLLALFWSNLEKWQKNLGILLGFDGSITSGLLAWPDLEVSWKLIALMVCFGIACAGLVLWAPVVFKSRAERIAVIFLSRTNAECQNPAVEHKSTKFEDGNWCVFVSCFIRGTFVNTYQVTIDGFNGRPIGPAILQSNL